MKLNYYLDNNISNQTQMSNLYLYFLLLSQGYIQVQIQRILHSILFYPDPSSRPFLNFRNQSSVFRPLIFNSTINLHDHQRISATNSIVKQKFDNQPQKNMIQDKNINVKQQEQVFIQQNFQEISSLNVKECQKVRKTRKKKKIKKVSLIEKRQKQMKRNKGQNANRNVIPIQIHRMLSILFKKNKSQKLVERLINKFEIQKQGMQVSLLVKRFYLYQSLLKQNISHYANEKSLKIMFTHLEPNYLIYNKFEQNLYCKIGLILIKHFLDNEATNINLNFQKNKALKQNLASSYKKIFIQSSFKMNKSNDFKRTYQI